LAIIVTVGLTLASVVGIANIAEASTANRIIISGSSFPAGTGGLKLLRTVGPFGGTTCLRVQAGQPADVKFAVRSGEVIEFYRFNDAGCRNWTSSVLRTVPANVPVRWHVSL
jgi:hypothetical protein